MQQTNGDVEMGDQTGQHPELPADILGEIFTLALPEEWEEHCAGRVRLPFAQVCRFWRATALGMSTLWNRIVVRLGDDDEASPPNIWGHAVAAYVERSGDANLHIIIDLSARDTGRVTDDFPSFDYGWQALCNHSHRWETVKLNAVPLDAFVVPPDAFDTVAQLPFSTLTSLTWHFAARPATSGNGAYDIPTTFFAHAPLLQCVEIGYVTRPLILQLPHTWRPRRLSIWAGGRRGRTAAGQLGRVYSPVLPDDAPYPSIYASMPALFGASPWLQELELSAAVVDPSALLDDRPTTFPALTWLRLLDDACEVSRMFVAPQLQQAILEADGSDDPTYWNPPVHSHPLKAFASLLTRPGGCTQLRSLYLSPQRFERVRHLLTCLESVPALEELVIDTADNDDYPRGILRFEVVQALTRRADDDRSMALLPSLTLLTLEFEMCMIMPFSADDSPEGVAYSPLPLYRAVWRMLASRRMRRVHHGVALRPLRAFSTNSWHLPGDRCAPWPLPSHAFGQMQSLLTATGDPVWPDAADAELAKILNETDEYVGIPMEPDFEDTDAEEDDEEEEEEEEEEDSE
ncbi:uncharacterized protein SCHCODRAFT_02618320 [Schizophyllum commune H4-8]|uniref:uncharacterized protein n=1 Tax=Schizophyllum commune (strain H4-8 / FGSC 9210) TaxID=578458 RepID=UPI00215F9471|nr:uncharacterized protein SCHCODRAFT_02618320 [Schizophyllum commune H4-8]KAI5895001.1 hypothetical protein SCHCODRAFT_02618320 [Schizophyllum commune H4-8]